MCGVPFRLFRKLYSLPDLFHDLSRLPNRIRYGMVNVTRWLSHNFSKYRSVRTVLFVIWMWKCAFIIKENSSSPLMEILHIQWSYIYENFKKMYAPQSSGVHRMLGVGSHISKIPIPLNTLMENVQNKGINVQNPNSLNTIWKMGSHAFKNFQKFRKIVFFR